MASAVEQRGRAARRGSPRRWPASTGATPPATGQHPPRLGRPSCRGSSSLPQLHGQAQARRAARAARGPPPRRLVDGVGVGRRPRSCAHRHPPWPSAGRRQGALAEPAGQLRQQHLVSSSAASSDTGATLAASRHRAAPAPTAESGSRTPPGCYRRSR
jgi:hypothetical protein